MPLPKEIRFVTFDAYGTLIDWESGAYDAFQKEADRDGFTIDKNALTPLFLNISREIEKGSSSKLKPSFSASFLQASMMPFSQSMRVP